MQAWLRARASVERLFWYLQPAPRPRWPALSPLARGIERGVHLLDSALPIPGTKLRVGLDPLVGMLVPAVGDAVFGMISVGMLFLAVQYRVPTRIIAGMALNIAVDAAVGGIPIVGDAFDFVWKANERNFALLMRHRGDLPKRPSPAQLLAAGALILLALTCVLAPLALLVWLAL
jgi:hypothetical protein